VTWDGKDRKALTDINSEGYYSASFSPGAQYYNLRYEGPEIPWQKVLKIGDNGKFNQDYIILIRKNFLYKTIGVNYGYLLFRFWNSFE